MICIDTNILSPAVETGNRAHSAAAAFLTSLQDFDDVVVADLVENGVTEFATVNEKDFRDFGFRRVWNPLS